MTDRILDTSNPDALLASMGFHPPDPARWCHPCSAGCGEMMLHPGYTCSDCETKAHEAKALAADLRKRIESIPVRYRGARFGEPMMLERVADKRALDVAVTALAHHTVVVLFGSPGSGKSTIAAAIAVEEATQGRSIAWAPSSRLAMARAEAKLGAEPPEVRDAIRANVTVVDDIGNEALTPTSAIVDVIFARHDAERPLIVTTGLTRLDLAKRYGGGAGRRLLENALLIEMKPRGAT